jgi:ATP-dependent protease ClpP protease subunit
MRQARPPAAKNPKPFAEFRPNPSRGVFLSGGITQELVYRLTPRIVELLHESREPITLYIDSPGGSVPLASQILNLLHAPSQDTVYPCKLITVTTTNAHSSGAILLSAGDYAIAGPNSLIHFHGVRMYRGDAITVEKASDAAKNLRESNDRSAMILARNCSQRFFFRVISLRSEFNGYRAANPQAEHDKDCFLGLILPLLSPWGAQVVKNAEVRVKRYAALSKSVISNPAVVKQLAKVMAPGGAYSKLEAEMLRAIIAFEVKSNSKRPDWTFSSRGLSQVTDDFLLLNEYIGHHQNDWIEGFCERWKDFVLEPADKEKIEKLPEDQRKAARVAKLTPMLLPLWLFLGAICRVLHEAESPLTATDAFWLGLIDEVIGADLPTLRKVVENPPLDNAKSRGVSGKQK